MKELLNDLHKSVTNPSSMRDVSRKAMISTTWAILHILFSWWDPSLDWTANKYLMSTWIKTIIDEESRNNISKFHELWKWIIISEHKSFNFSDYLPIFAELWDKILEKCVFYTWDWNLAMNQREFSNYQFRSATLKENSTKEDKDNLKKQVQKDIEKVKREWWYIFIIPSWDDSKELSNFKSLFREMIKNSDDDLSVLVNHIQHKTQDWENINVWYKDIWKSMLTKKLWEFEISSQMTKASQWKDKKWNESREFYESIRPTNS